jgi:hypothetical protein
LVVELALGDPTLDTWVDDKAQRVLLKRGDSFFVLPGNTYRYFYSISSVLSGL